MIITDPVFLHCKSVNVDIPPLSITSKILQSILETAKDLLSSVPPDALGLAAPQIGDARRMFVANLSTGRYLFINPELTWKSPDLVPSTEGCLSLPGLTKCVSRHFRVKITADEIIKVIPGVAVAVDGAEHLCEKPSWDNATYEMLDDDHLSLSGLDSFIVQHENDHLDGILLTDLPEAPTPQEIAEKKSQDRIKRLQHQRHKEHVHSHKKPLSPEQKKQEKKRLKRLERRVKIQETYIAEKNGLFS